MIPTAGCHTLQSYFKVPDVSHCNVYVEFERFPLSLEDRHDQQDVFW